VIDPRTKLTVIHDDNGVFVDHTQNAADYLRDTFDIELIAAEDYLYVGFDKPFGAIYTHVTVANTNASVFAAEVWDGAAWVAVELTDESNGLARSGFMFWDKTGMNSTDVNGQTKYWIRFRPDVDHSATTVRGINLIFADDAMLKSEFFEIDNSNLLPPGETSHLVHHVSARNNIVQHLRNQGYKITDADGNKRPADQWDLIDVFEIRQASVFLTLAKIFFNLSDGDDHWWLKYREYAAKHKRIMEGLTELSFDANDDGVDDNNEVQARKKVQRWRR